MSIVGAKKMRIDSRYPIDKVVYLQDGFFNMSATTTNIVTIPHGLPFTPLCSGAWSTTPDFSVQYEFSSGTFPSTNPGYVFQTIFNVFADENNVYVSGDNVGSALTVYVRIYGFEPPNSGALLEGIASEADPLTIDSRLNYPKLYLNDYVDLPAGGSSDSFVYIPHNIGTVPQVMGWVTYDTYNGISVVPCIHPVATSNGASEGIVLIVGDEQIAFGIPAFVSAHRAYYRVYLDE